MHVRECECRGYGALDGGSTMSQDRDCILVAPLVGEVYFDLGMQLAPAQIGQRHRYKAWQMNRDVCVCACVSEFRERERERGGEIGRARV